MDAGRVLATGTPAALIAARGAATLEDAFISYLEEADGRARRADRRSRRGARPTQPRGASRAAAGRGSACGGCSPTRSARRWNCCAIRSGSASRCSARRLLMLVFGFGISTDVNNLSFAVLDHDQTPESRAYLEELRGSTYFIEKPPLADYADLEKRLQDGDIKAAHRNPAGLRPRHQARPARLRSAPGSTARCRSAPQTIRGYLQGMHQLYLADPAVEDHAAGAARRPPISRSGSSTTRISTASTPWCRRRSRCCWRCSRRS